MPASLALTGSGLNNASGSVTPNLVVPNGVTADMTSVVLLGWAVTTGSETPPTVTPIGSGWTTLVAPRTANTMGYAAFSCTGRDAGDVLAFTFGGNRIQMAQDFYVTNAAVPVAGTVTNRPGSANVSTAVGLTTTEANELVLAVTVDRSTGSQTATPSGANQVSYLDNTGSAVAIWLGLVPAPTVGATGTVTVTYSGSATASGGGYQLAFPALAPDVDVPPDESAPTRGGWYSLLSIREEQLEAARAESDPPVACPNDGEPLQSGPDGQLYCPFDGWQYL